MKRIFLLSVLILPIFIVFSFFSASHSATMNDYCQNPAFISTPVAPNILFVIDVSGSMSWWAYMDAYSDATQYEGYFTLDKIYQYNSGQGYWEETTGTATSCPTWSWPSTSNKYTGNCLNWWYMTRIDLVRWAVTGGTPSTCTGSKTFNKDSCDPELYNEPGNQASGKVGTVCNDTIGGCILLGDYGVKVKVPWSRINSSLTTTFKNLSVQPRMGAMFYSGTGVRSNGKVYIGDFTAPNTTSTQFPYMNLITAINSSDPSGATPTGPAMWDALNYYRQTSPQYGGIPVQSGEGDRWKNPMYVCDGGGANCVLTSCARNFTILLSDGSWNVGTDGSIRCSIDNGFENASADPVVPAYKMHMGFTNAGANVATSVSAVYGIGIFLGGTGDQAMKNVAMYGSFDKAGRTWPDNLTGYPQVTCTMDDCGSGKGSGCTALPASSPDWDSNANNLPDTYYSASTASGIKDAILNAVLDALRRATSGTAVSVLASGEGSGANMLQAVFYPKRAFGTTEIDWTGEMQNLWYYIDPFLQSSTIREDTDSNKILKLLTGDRVISFFFDTSENKTKARLYNDTDGDGDADGSYVDTVPIEDLKNLWEAGTLLWSRTSARTIKTTIGSSLIDFSTANESTLRNYLQAADATEGTKIINYIHGTDQTGYRNRTVAIDLNKDGDTVDTGESAKVWKMGDIISSTPRLQSSIRLNTYHLLTPQGYGDTSYQTYTNSNNYKGRGMVYVGANDGMLHAFKLGKLEFKWTGQAAYEKARLTDADLSTLGREEWAFIPKNALPYLKYMADPNYCHLYYIDAPSYIFDASINAPSGCTGNYWTCDKQTTVDGSNNLTYSDTSWRTILIGGMGQGGACRNYNATCTECVKTPIDGIGYSSYFALDVTDPTNPTLLWEFSSDQLGFSTSGPAIVRMGPGNKNGRWFAVFASGPTGEINTSSDEFMGKSDQNLKLFVLDLKTGTLVRTIDTGIANAFGGSMFNASIDADRWSAAGEGVYSDDVFYVGYVQRSGSTWADSPTGGILRVITKDKDGGDADTDIDGIDPANWSVSTVINGIGPVTTAVAKLQDRKTGTLWLYFGTGRFFYKTDDPGSSSDKEEIFGIKEPCYTTANDMDNTCTSSVSFASLSDRTATGVTGVPTHGWYISLDAPTGSYNAERVITDPLAAFSGAVFFTTFAPTSDVCGFGGNTYLWAVRYDTGYEAISLLQGKAMIQVSTGEIKELTLPSVLVEKESRRTAAITGMPPKGQGLSVVINPKPMKRIMHIQEK